MDYTQIITLGAVFYIFYNLNVAIKRIDELHILIDKVDRLNSLIQSTEQKIDTVLKNQEYIINKINK